MMSSQRKQISLVIFGLSILATACGKQQTADVSISSAPVSFTGATSLMSVDPVSNALSFVGAPSASVVSATDFSFCVKRVKLEGEDGQPVKKDGETGESGEKDADDISFTPGLITITDNTTVDWGKMNIPVNFKLKKIKIKVKKAPSLCNGATYSVKFNGFETPEDIEFKWKFEPALELDSATGALQLSLASVVNALRTALTDSASFNGADLKSHIEAIEESAEKK